MHVSTQQNELHLPLIRMALIPTLFPGSSLVAGPKHSTSVPFSSGVAVPLSVDVKEVALVPNPVPGVAVKALFLPIGPQESLPVDTCAREHQLLLPFTFQMVTPFLSPTVQVNVKVSPGQVGGAAVKCPATSPGEIEHLISKNLLG